MRVASDHHPLLLTTMADVQQRGRKKEIFRVEEMWFRDETCLQICTSAWTCEQLVPSPNNLSKRLQNCRDALQEWESSHFGNVSKQLNDCRKEWDAHQRETGGNVNHEVQRRMERQMESLLKKEEVMWKQRSRASWLKEGDRNTSYFHRTANGRHKRKLIDHLHLEDGSTATDEKDIEREFRRYFVDLFKHREDIEMEEALDAVEPVVTPEINEMLSAPFMAEEIKKALSQMHPLKAPGPDEALSTLIRRAETQRLLHGARICRGAPEISHLFFADDSIIFGRATNQELDCVKHILEIYEKASGQMVNYDKSEIAFSAGNDGERSTRLAARMGARCVQKHGIYLGMPCMVGR